MKFVNFAANVQNVFNNDVNDFIAFSNLLTETALGTQHVSKSEANAKIVEVFQGVLGLDKNSKPAEVRKAIRRNQALVFDIIEETVQSLLVTGWGNDPFMMKYVDQRNLALGDRNEFYAEDDSVLSVMKIAGNHHDIIRQRLAGGSVESIKSRLSQLTPVLSIKRYPLTSFRILSSITSCTHVRTSMRNSSTSLVLWKKTLSHVHVIWMKLVTDPRKATFFHGQSHQLLYSLTQF